ncbi:MAG: hypothetical protein CL662_12175 [Bacteroidetes bacterium]|jgi:hypothetical protein|nr:hypothetical protein [Bacteroidota bacterium]HCI72309.1 hypothetical protein [Balneola sp.]|tara:strand:+ start:835 stop:1695 length:861 start_codon:yes stop_codon:yes gene_type:complete
MRLAYHKQKFQDWFTQQWIIVWGKRIESNTVPWLMGPFGKSDWISDEFVKELAQDEGLVIERNVKSQGLISSIELLGLTEDELKKLSNRVIEFYQKTAEYNLELSVRWNFVFKVLGNLVKMLFSKRIDQLNIPTESISSSEEISSEIITLTDPDSEEIKYTIWYRTFKTTGQVLYSGVYSVCTLPSGLSCIKAVFPLPKGNATVIMSPSVGQDGELHLYSSGKKFGDPGFYFLLEDSKGDLWAQYIRSFRDLLIVSSNEEGISAKQTLTLWNKEVVQFRYKISRNR